MRGPGSDAAPTYVIVAEEAAHWGIPAQLVARVVEPTEWRGAPPLDVGRLLAAGPRAAGRRRILVLAEAGRERPLWTAGPILSRPVAAQRICALPPLVAARVTPGIVGVMFDEDGPPVLLLDAWRLGATPGV